MPAIGVDEAEPHPDGMAGRERGLVNRRATLGGSGHL
jgi:hypothetical protein